MVLVVERIYEKCLRDWRKKRASCCKAMVIRDFHGKKANCPGTEEKLYEYINDQWLFECAVAIRICQLKASLLVKEQKL
jgi:hypothetical protein